MTDHSQPRQSGVVLAHDWLVGLRGGEWVLDRLARLFGPTDLYTLVNDGRFLTEAIAACNVITSPLQKFPGARGRARRAYLPLMPWAVERLRVGATVQPSNRPNVHTSQGDPPEGFAPGAAVDWRARACSTHPTRLVISTSSAVMKSIKPPAGVPHLCYCHSPARYIWEQGGEYASGSGGALRSIGLLAVRRRFQEWDRRTANDGRVTKFIANSHHTAARIMRCYGREATVIHPPVRTEFFTSDATIAREEWLLVVAALEPYKKTDIVIDAAIKAGWPLKVAGSGSQMESLKRRAGEHQARSRIEMLGRVDDATLRDLYCRARALVFPQVEDFGIIAAEAQACGCPVIAFSSGGAREIVTQATGVFMPEQTHDAVIAAERELEKRTIDPQACRENALRFSEARFDEAMLGEADALLQSSR